ncbi:MAG: sensor histidine kinase [Acidimicrobiia bacterium]|nr:sensor histidine kinase [Acidimicrobiia bacterium]
MKLDDRRRAITMDVLLAVGLFISALGSVTVWDAGDSTARAPDLFGYALVGLQTLPLIWRRRAPVAVLVLTIIGFIIDRGLNYPGSWAVFGISVAIYTVGAELEPRRSLLVGAITIDIVLLWTLVGVFVYDVEWLALLSEIAFLGFPLLVGRETYHRQRRMVELESRAIHAEHEREQRAAEAVVNERVRIARELHDVVAHEMTVMTIQSAGARRVLDSEPARAAAAMASVEAAGHRGLTEMRRLLGMLRTTDPKSTTPQPGLESLDGLVRQMELAGLPTTLNVDGIVQDLPAGIDLNAYRIVQEALTNTLKHGGPGVTATVSLDYRDDALNIDVMDDGYGAAASSAGDGQGLVGMHERIALLQGSMNAGPRPGGGFRVSAKIPIPA